MPLLFCFCREGKCNLDKRNHTTFCCRILSLGGPWEPLCTSSFIDEESLLRGGEASCSVVQLLSCVQLKSCKSNPMDCSMPGFPVLYYLPELAQTQVHWVAVAIKPSNFLSPTSSPAFSLHSIVVFSNELALPIRWPKYWGFSFSINPSNEYSGLISFRTDWFDLLINEWMSKKWMSEGCKIFLLIPQMSFSSFICTITKFYFIYLSSLSQEFLVDEAHVTFFFVPQIC